jgi:ribonuclease VapC
MGRVRLAEMIAVDTSAIVAIVFDEPERPDFAAAIDGASRVLISSVSVVETKMVVHHRWGMRAVILADDLLKLPQFEIISPGLADVEAAMAAFLVYGKGSGHRAALNFGDVFSYANAKVRDLPLLYKGNDFAETDLRPVVSIFNG